MNITDPAIYLEVGFGTDPSALRGNRLFTGNKQYIGVDNASENSRHNPYMTRYDRDTRCGIPSLQAFASVFRPGENIEFQLKSLHELELAAGSVREVYMANVLTSPLTEDDRRALLAKTALLLAPGGELIVKVSSWEDETSWPRQKVIDMITASALEPLVSVDSTDAAFGALEDTYGRIDGDPGGVGYYVIAQKPYT